MPLRATLPNLKLDLHCREGESSRDHSHREGEHLPIVPHPGVRRLAAVEAAVQQANNQNWADSDSGVDNSDGASPKPRGSVVLDNVI